MSNSLRYGGSAIAAVETLKKHWSTERVYNLVNVIREQAKKL